MEKKITVHMELETFVPREKTRRIASWSFLPRSKLNQGERIPVTAMITSIKVIASREEMA
jgi:hypothetical protein